MENCPYFYENQRPIIAREQYIGRENEFEQLERYLINNNPVLILGPEGIGKSGFLSCFCRLENRKRLASEHRILISMYSIPTALTDQDLIYKAFTDAVVNAGELLKDVGETECYEAIHRTIDGKLNNPTIGSSSLLQQVCNAFKDNACCVYLFVDQFERFISNQSVCIEHHDILRYLLDYRMLNMVIATDFDLNGNTLPSRVRGSYLLQRFTNSLTVKPLSFSEVCSYLDLIGNSGDFTHNVLEMIYYLSGGIPVLARYSALVIYTFKQEHPGEEVQINVIRNNLMANLEIEKLLQNWLSILDEREAGLLNMMAEKAYEPQIHPILPQYRDNCCSHLVDRGLIQSLTERGRAETWCFEFNSWILADFCQTYPVSAYVPAPLPTLSVIDLLRNQLDPQDFREQFLRSVAQKKLTLEQANTLLKKYTDDIVNISPDEQVILSETFAQYHTNGESGISERILHRVSQRTKEYLMMAVIMEKRIPSFVSDTIQNDASAKILYYGKALEQHLRDCWVPVIKELPNLTDVNDIKNKDPNFLTIGNFVAALKNNHATLSGYCRQHLAQDTNWEEYLERYIKNIGTAGSIRNSADHATDDASKVSTADDVEKMKQLCFEGENSIFECSFTADLLMKRRRDIWINYIVDGNNTATMICDTVDKDQTMRGHIQGTDCPVLVSAAQVKNFQLFNPMAILDAKSTYIVHVLGSKTENGERILTASIQSIKN